MILERDDALAICQAAFRGVPDSGGCALFIRGEAGIGKSTLLSWFLRSLPPEAPRALALCDPLDTPRPLGPVRELEAALARRRGSVPDDSAAFETLLHRLQRADGPVVLAIEDLHWADQRSLDWLQFIGRRLSQLPVLLIGSFRDDEAHVAHPLHSAIGAIPARLKTQIELRPLSLDAIARLANGDRLPPAELREITGGNPFFLTEMLARDIGREALPRSVADAVNARLNGLPAPLSRFLETLSCCPGPIPLDWMRRFEGGAALCDAAAQRKFLVAAGADFKFCHELMRLAIQDRLPPAARRAAHAAFLTILLEEGADEERLDRIVHHALGAHRSDILRDVAPRAAACAARLGAHREAARHLAHLLPLLDDDDPAFSAAIHESYAYEAGLALTIDAEVIAAREKAVALWRRVGDVERVGENLRWLSRLHWYRGEAETAQSYVRAAIAELEGLAASPARAKACALRAQFHMLQDEMPAAVEWGERALALAREVGDQEIVAHALNTIGSARMFRGDRTGETLLRESLAISLERGYDEQAARVYTNLSECLVEARALEEAATLLEQGIAFDAAHDLDAWTYYLIGRKAQLLFEMDRYEESVRIADDALMREGQTLLMRMPALIIRARALLRMGAQGAEAALCDALEHARKIDEPQYLAALHIAQIEAAVLADAPARAAGALDWLTARDPDLLSPRKRGEALFWSALAGRVATGLDAPAVPAPFRRAAAGAFETAEAEFRAEGSVYLALWALAAQGSPAGLRAADQGFARIGAAAARQALRRRGASNLGALRPSARAAAARHPYALTPAELRVLGHLVNGQSNARIAETLCRSRRTVENHVAAIFSKLHCKTRVEVVLRCQNEPSILPQEPA